MSPLHLPKWYVYSIRCRNGNYYTGISTDVEERVKTHNAGKGSKAVRAFGLPVTLVAVSHCMDKGSALRLEAHIKKLKRVAKEQYIRRWLHRACLVRRLMDSIEKRNKSKESI